MRDIHSMSRGESLGQKPSEKGSEIKGLVVCNGWDLELWELLNDLALGCCYSPPPELLIGIVFTVFSYEAMLGRDSNP